MSARRLVALVTLHGGIATVRTHRVRSFDRSTGAECEGWTNTITCRDGYVRRLTTTEERILIDDLPEELRATEHITDD